MESWVGDGDVLCLVCLATGSGRAWCLAGCSKACVTATVYVHYVRCDFCVYMLFVVPCFCGRCLVCVSSVVDVNRGGLRW